MTKRFLSRELIILVAFQMIDENGTNSFSVRQLAAKLGVQVSSLYNHIDNEYDLLLEVAKLTAAMYTDYIEDTVKDLSLEDAAFKAGDAFRIFFCEHKYLYELLLDRRWMGDPKFDEVTEKFTQPIYFLMQSNTKDKTAMDHIYVAMRVVTHGFATLDSLGVFDGLSVDATESYHMMIKSVIDMMNNLSKQN